MDTQPQPVNDDIPHEIANAIATDASAVAPDEEATAKLERIKAVIDEQIAESQLPDPGTPEARAVFVRIRDGIRELQKLGETAPRFMDANGQQMSVAFLAACIVMGEGNDRAELCGAMCGRNDQIAHIMKHQFARFPQQDQLILLTELMQIFKASKG